MKCTKAFATETTVLRLDSDLYLLSTHLIIPSKMSFFIQLSMQRFSIWIRINSSAMFEAILAHLTHLFGSEQL